MFHNPFAGIRRLLSHKLSIPKWMICCILMPMPIAMFLKLFTYLAQNFLNAIKQWNDETSFCWNWKIAKSQTFNNWFCVIIIPFFFYLPLLTLNNFFLKALFLVRQTALPVTQIIHHKNTHMVPTFTYVKKYQQLIRWAFSFTFTCGYFLPTKILEPW